MSLDFSNWVAFTHSRRSFEGSRALWYRNFESPVERGASRIWSLNRIRSYLERSQI